MAQRNGHSPFFAFLCAFAPVREVFFIELCIDYEPLTPRSARRAGILPIRAAERRPHSGVQDDGGAVILGVF
jgi:hypothetical protein